MCQVLLEVGKMHFCFIFELFVFQSIHSSHFSLHFSFHFSVHSVHSSAKHPKMIQKWSQKWAENGLKMATVNNPNVNQLVNIVNFVFDTCLDQHFRLSFFFRPPIVIMHPEMQLLGSGMITCDIVQAYKTNIARAIVSMHCVRGVHFTKMKSQK